jgi:thiol-disulfide isomerase/thioredoxin
MNVLLKKIFFIAAILLFLSLIVFLTQNKNTAPNVIFTTIEGKKIAMENLKGKVVLVNFWATDCRVCINEMPALVSTYQQFHHKGLEIVAVAMPYDPPAQVLNYVKIKKPPFPVMHDGLAEITDRFGHVELTPTAFIYNKQGKLLQHTIGALDFVKLNQLLNVQLAVKN